jgi:FixJ family two-component response regulator
MLATERFAVLNGAFATATIDGRPVMAQNPTIFIADDDPAARESVAALVQSAGYLAESFPSAEAFLRGFDRSRPGCLVADIRMLEMSGLDLQERLRSEDCPLPVIIISAYANAPLAVKAMKQGAVNLLEKPCHDSELLDSVRLAVEIDAERRRARAELAELQFRLKSLREDERRVLDAIVAGKANKVIARELNIGLRTVEARRHNVFEKMKADSLAELVKMMVTIENGGEPIASQK